MSIVNWVLGASFLVIALIAGLVAGAIGYGVTLGITRKSHNERSLGIAILVSALVGQAVFWGLCAWTLRGIPAPIAQPTAGEVVGVWKMSLESIKVFPLADQDPGLPHTLTLNDDGTLIAENIPTWWLYYKGMSGRIVSGTGTWSITKQQGKWKLLINLSDLSLDWSETALFLVFEGEKPPFLLYDYVGDGDEGRRVVFWRSPRETEEPVTEVPQ